MKKRVLVWCLAVTACSLAGLVERTGSGPVLAGYVEVAPFNAVRQKASLLGGLIQNPIVPTLLTSSLQSQVTETFGPFRPDAPFAWCVYVQMPAWQVAATNDDLVAMADLCDVVAVYPTGESLAAMRKNHPGSTVEADGSLHLLPGEGAPNDQWVKFSADGAFCAFAGSAGLAARGLKDFAAARGGTATGSPLVRMEITPGGLDALLSCFDALNQGEAGVEELLGTELAAKLAAFQAIQRTRRRETIAALQKVSMTLELDDAGVTWEAVVQPKAGAPLPAVAGLELPPDALAGVPPDAPYFGGQFALMGGTQEKEFRAVLELLADLCAWGGKEAQKREPWRPYAPFIREVAGIAADAAREMTFPSARDWGLLSLAFDSAHHPWLGISGERVGPAKTRETEEKLWRRLFAAVDRQWPGRKMLVEVSPEETVVDWGAVIDVAAAETGTGQDEPSARAVRQAKKNVARFLGAGKMRLVGREKGSRVEGFIAAQGVKPRAGASNAEARLAAALPAVAARRPGGVFYLSLYALLRNEIAPIVEQFVDVSTAEELGRYMAVLPEPEPNSALAGAAWCGADGARRVQVRVTANEIRNFGAAFNACMAAALTSGGKKKGRAKAR